MSTPPPEDLDLHDAMDGEEESQPARRPRARRAWSPDLDAEVAGLLRLLNRRCWLVAGRDDDAIASVRRNQDAIVDVLRRLGWVLVVERDVVRLRKSPPPRPEAWAFGGPDPRTCSWFFLLVAAAESLPPRVALSQLATAARVAAADAGLPSDGSLPERRAMVAALRLLDERGLIPQLEGDVEGYLVDDNAPVLLAIHHNRLLHVVANAGSGNPAADPAGWLAGVRREPDTSRRMRRRLVDDALVHVVDLDESETDWLRRRLRGDDGGPLAAAFGLEIERRSEGAAFVVPEDTYRYDKELGPLPFPVSGGTVAHAALLLCDTAAADGLTGTGTGTGTDAVRDGDTDDRTSEPRSEAMSYRLAPGRGPGTGWRGLPRARVVARISELAAAIGSGRGGWSAELAENPDLLADRVHNLLRTRDLLRVETTHDGREQHSVWWFSPATGRWPVPPAAAATPRRPRTAAGDDHATLFDAGAHPDEAPGAAEQGLLDLPGGST